GDRWILCLQKAKPEQIRRWPEIIKRIEAVRKFRTTEGGNLSKSLAETPLAFHVTVIPESPFLAIPEVSSERREYVPFGWLEPPVVPSNKIIVVDKASFWLFGVISSKMHMAWLRHIGGRLKSDYQYSSGIVYNTFPWPSATPAQTQKIEFLGQAILDARAEYPEATLADLYDPDTMPPNLRRAHKTLDTAIDKLYRPAPFTSDRERVEHLFTLYEKLSSPALAAMAAPRPKRRKTPL
ncbi:type IIL restriction-modification enzyme MmeI, partial [Acidocella sp.]|uniref:type IIL restriction-modification enzyme MmeI n=2 Tax=Acidocella sp. TaxID=50710 RepID=UPI003450AB21